jgi:membrane-associated phospholipid phosphatase
MKKRLAYAVALLAFVGGAWLTPQPAASAELGSLLVEITSPSSGSTVSGTIEVRAKVTIIGLIAVGGVQFQVDGANIGGEDGSAPYSVSWNTTGAANGSHKLTAVARSTLGLRFTSNPVAVTVKNGPPPDTTRPTVTINQAAGQADPTSAAPINFTTVFSDAVSGFTGADVMISGTAGGFSVTVTVTGGPSTYNVAVSGMTSAGTVIATIAADVAQDAAGNTNTASTSTDNTVTFTAPPPAPVRRFEETDPSIAYTAGWMPDAHGSLSGGAAAASRSSGAQATFTFTGSSVSWIGGRASWTGIARVFLDGSFVAEVDMYSRTVEVQVPLFTAVGLSNTSHTLTIEVTGRQNAAATDTWVLVDAFDVPPATISRLQETDPSVTYTGDWLQGDRGNEWSGGTAAASLTPGHQATFTFTGTGVRWLSARGPQHGIARVFLDGAFVTEVDTYSIPDAGGHTVQVQAGVFTATGLADAPHTLTIEVTGRRNPDSQFAVVVVDAFEVTLPGTRRQETDPAITYSPGWIQGNRDKPYSEGTAAVSTTSGAQATFTFTGTSVRWIGARGPQTGIARVILDGVVVADSLDTYAPTEVPQTTVFTSPGLAAGSHTLTIEVTGLNNPASAGASIVVDAFDVTP